MIQPRHCKLVIVSAETELLSLLCPVNRKVSHLRDSETARQSAINRSLHDVGSKEGERQDRALGHPTICKIAMTLGTS